LAKLAAKDNPQTMLGVFEQRWGAEPVPASAEGNATWLALEAVRDPGNLGTIVRTVDAVGGSGVILIGNCVDPYARETVRASMGSIFNVPLVRVSTERALALAAAWKGDVVGTQLSAREDFRGLRYRALTLLVMGSEGPGLSPELAAACSRRVKIPMAGRLDSLNLAVATGLMLYEIRRDRLKI
jgi:TrmH family RNA methyltransferase